MVRVIQSKVKYDGMVFDSKEELGFYLELLNTPGVSCIHRQTQFTLIPKQEQMVIKHLKTKDKLVNRLLERPVQYHADFVYRLNDIIVICDVKSQYTASFREFPIIRKLMVRKIIKHNKKRHKGEPKMVFLEAIVKTLPKKSGGGVEVKYNYKPFIENEDNRNLFRADSGNVCGCGTISFADQ